jgi:hypothetical protein
LDLSVKTLATMLELLVSALPLVVLLVLPVPLVLSELV